MKLRYIKFFLTLLITNSQIFQEKIFASLNSDSESIEIVNSSEELKEDKIFDDNYILGSGDVISLRIFDAMEFSGDYQIYSSGKASLPLIGTVELQNLSINQATKKLTSLYEKELIRPELHLMISVQRPLKVLVIGEVESPGLYSLTTNELNKIEGGPTIRANGLPTLVDAIQKAGGLTNKANLSNVNLKRRLPGEQISYKETDLNLVSLLFEGDQTQNPFLFDGDIITLKETKEIPKNIINIAKANLSPKTIKVTIIGEVVNPGDIEVESNTPLNQAILKAGGLIDLKSNKNNIDLFRINRDGSITKEKFSFNTKNQLSISKNPPLSNGDIVIVNSSLFGKTSNVINIFGNPLSNVINAINLYKLLD